MVAVRGIYDNGEVRLLEPLAISGRRDVVITILDDVSVPEPPPYRFAVLTKLAGAISARTDGSVHHDRYIYAKENV